jgi:nitroreductase
MSTTTKQPIIDIIRDRHSVRKYDPTVTISREEIMEIMNEATQAPSSSNLQPWHFIVIDDHETKKELRQIAFNQEQVETSSAVIAVLGDKEMYQKVENVYRSNYEAGYMDENTMQTLIENSNRVYSNAPEEVRKNIASFDAGLVSMQLMLVAKAKGYDTVTMGGFDKQKFIDKFNVSDRYMPIVLIALGKAAAPAHKTTRLPLEDVVEFV